MVAICCNRLKIVCVIAAAARSAACCCCASPWYQVPGRTCQVRYLVPGTSCVTVRTVKYHSLRVMSFAVDLQSVLVDM